MNPTGKKFLSLFLVFSLVTLSTNLYAKKHGAKLVIMKKNGRQIEGELITVKEDSLLILNKKYGIDESVGIEEIKTIRIANKSPNVLGVVGFLSGLAIGAYQGVRISAKVGEDDPELGKLGAIYLGILLVLLFAGIGAALGMLPGLLTRIKAKFQVEGMTDSEIQDVLDKLRKKARVRDYK